MSHPFQTQLPELVSYHVFGHPCGHTLKPRVEIKLESGNHASRKCFFFLCFVDMMMECAVTRFHATYTPHVGNWNHDSYRYYGQLTWVYGDARRQKGTIVVSGDFNEHLNVGIRGDCFADLAQKIDLQIPNDDGHHDPNKAILDVLQLHGRAKAYWFRSMLTSDSAAGLYTVCGVCQSTRNNAGLGENGTPHLATFVP